ncbi:MAG: translation initiation factor IF-6 [Thermoplasmatota archaeon]
MLIQMDFNGSPYLGVFAKANDSVVVMPPTVGDETREALARSLDAKPVITRMGGSNIVGAVIALNNHGAVVADFADESEIEPLRATGLKVARIAGKLNAAGNNVLANDTGALVNPDLGKTAVEEIRTVLGVRVEKGTIAGLKTVGSAAVATRKGALCHPKATEEEISFLQGLLGVETRIGTVNHGAPYIGAGLVANTKGCAIGRATTGPEMNRIEDALGYL